MTSRMFIKKILEKENFFFVFANNLDEIFSDGWIEVFDDSDMYVGCSSTYGWADAFIKTCYEFDLEDCWRYYDSLNWEDSDDMDYFIERLLVAAVFDEDGKRIKW